MIKRELVDELLDAIGNRAGEILVKPLRAYADQQDATIRELNKAIAEEYRKPMMELAKRHTTTMSREVAKKLKREVLVLLAAGTISNHVQDVIFTIIDSLTED